LTPPKRYEKEYLSVDDLDTLIQYMTEMGSMNDVEALVFAKVKRINSNMKRHHASKRSWERYNQAERRDESNSNL